MVNSSTKGLFVLKGRISAEAVEFRASPLAVLVGDQYKDGSFKCATNRALIQRLRTQSYAGEVLV